MKHSELAAHIEHTNLKPFATLRDIEKLCAEAKKYRFYGVCVNPCWIKEAKKALEGTGIRVISVIGFPLGTSTTASKVCEAQKAIRNGADEIDMVINICFLKSGRYDVVQDEISAVKKACGRKILKVIIECCYLTDEEKAKACQIAMKAGADFVKTSTGFGSGGATVEDVKLIKSVVGNRIGIKASGGIKTYEGAVRMIGAGANRIGTSSGVEIIKGAICREEG